MKHILIFFCIIHFCLNCAFAQGWQWKKTLGGPCREGANMVTDNNGNVYVVGNFSISNPIQCGPSYIKIESDTMYSTGENDIFLAKYDSAGNYLWSKRFGGNNPSGVTNQEASTIEYDSATNSIYLYGKIYGTVTIGTITLNCQAMDLFIAKFDLNGNCIWAKNFGSAYNDVMRGDGTFCVYLGNVYLSGILYDSSYVGTYYLPPGDFLASFDFNGNCLWAKNIGEINGVPGNFTTDFGLYSVNAKGNAIFITGIGSDTMIIDGITLTGASSNTLLCKFDLNGNIIAAKFGAERAISSRSDLDSSINIYTFGIFSDSLIIEDTVLINSWKDVFIAKHDSSFNLIWIRQLNATGDVAGNSIKIDNENNFYLTGSFQGSANFGGQTLSNPGSNVNMFLARYNTDGDCLGVDRAFSDAQNIGRSMAMNNNSVYLVGAYFGYIKLGNDTLNSLGWDDIFIAKHDAIITSTQNRFTGNNSGYQLLIYANPNTGKCNITVPDEFSKEENLTLRIFDNTGKLIQEQTVEMYEDKVKVNLEAEAKGIYNVTLSNKKKSYAGKIVFE